MAHILHMALCAGGGLRPTPYMKAYFIWPNTQMKCMACGHHLMCQAIKHQHGLRPAFCYWPAGLWPDNGLCQASAYGLWPRHIPYGLWPMAWLWPCPVGRLYRICSNLSQATSGHIHSLHSFILVEFIHFVHS